MSQLPPRPIYQKTKPIRDEAYRRHVASQPCMACSYAVPNDEGFISQAAHISVGNYGRSMKADDSLCIPLCPDRPNGERGCHSVFDQSQEYFCATYFRLTIPELKAKARAAYDEWKAAS